MTDRTSYWNDIYNKKEFEDTSWYQAKPESSLNLIESLGLSRQAPILDVGGGNSFLVDHLLTLGYEDLHVLDISKVAVNKAKERLGEDSSKVEWLVTDITQFGSENMFDVWHDRAAFHFLTEDEQVNGYISILNKSLKPGGYFILATFSENGPEKCSGLSIRQYSPNQMEATFQKFEKMGCQTENHQTPFGTTQHFLFCSFKRRA